mmetsp:Transcript_15851/g.43391  ORF Transcript_15851/g.43391 Transcript_15851/m.43391 type:complete len:298 (+) Transcript_15851:273-1166(+)
MSLTGLRTNSSASSSRCHASRASRVEAPLIARCPSSRSDCFRRRRFGMLLLLLLLLVLPSSWRTLPVRRYSSAAARCNLRSLRQVKSSSNDRLGNGSPSFSVSTSPTTPTRETTSCRSASPRLGASARTPSALAGVPIAAAANAVSYATLSCWNLSGSPPTSGCAVRMATRKARLISCSEAPGCSPRSIQGSAASTWRGCGRPPAPCDRAAPRLAAAERRQKPARRARRALPPTSTARVVARALESGASRGIVGAMAMTCPRSGGRATPSARLASSWETVSASSARNGAAVGSNPAA